MKNKQLWYVTIVTVLMLVIGSSLSSCKKEVNNKPPIDGSFAVKEVIGEPLFYDYDVYDTDSVSTNGVLFEASEPESTNVTYKWQIGTDPRTFTTKTVELNFFSAPINVVDVTLTVTKTDANNQVLTATTTRKVYLKRASQIPGVYEGYFANNPTKATVTIQKNFALPKYDFWMYTDYKGTLITSNIPYFDTIFISDNGHDHLFLNRKFYVLEDFAYLVMPDVNKHTQKHSGSITLSKDYNNITINFTARDVKTLQDLNINFTGNRKNKNKKQ
jgi:hypothetical protein